MGKPSLRELEKRAAQARQAMQEAAEDFARRLGEVNDDSRLTGEGRIDAARRLAEERRDELGRLGQAEAEALQEYADAADGIAMRRPWAERSPMADRPTRKAFLGRDGAVQEGRYREALKQWREGLVEATYVETAARGALEALREMPPEALATKFGLAMAEGDTGTLKAVQALALQRMARPLPAGDSPLPNDHVVTEEDWPAWALVERELGPDVKPVPSADPATWALVGRIAKAEESIMGPEQLAAREKVMTGRHRVPPTDLNGALAGEGIHGELLVAAQDGLDGSDGHEE